MGLLPQAQQLDGCRKRLETEEEAASLKLSSMPVSNPGHLQGVARRGEGGVGADRSCLGRESDEHRLCVDDTASVTTAATPLLSPVPSSTADRIRWADMSDDEDTDLPPSLVHCIKTRGRSVSCPSDAEMRKAASSDDDDDALAATITGDAGAIVPVCPAEGVKAVRGMDVARPLGDGASPGGVGGDFGTAYQHHQTRPNRKSAHRRHNPAAHRSGCGSSGGNRRHGRSHTWRRPPGTVPEVAVDGPMMVFMVDVPMMIPVVDASMMTPMVDIYPQVMPTPISAPVEKEEPRVVPLTGMWDRGVKWVV